MVSDDDIAERVLEGDAYELAAMTIRRTFAVSLRRKVHLAVGVLTVSVLLGPALFARRNLIRSFEGTRSLAETLGLSITVLALFGVLTTFVAGLLLVRHRYVVRRRTLDRDRARRMIRVEDVLMWFLLQGTVFVLIAVAASLLGVLSPETVQTLYANGVVVYRPAGVGVDARTVSVLGGLLALILSTLWLSVDRERTA